MTQADTPDGVKLELGQLRKLEVASLIEATTLVLLLGVAVPLKHFAGRPEAVTVMGPVHGIAFCFYVRDARPDGGERRLASSRVVAAGGHSLRAVGGYTNLMLIRRKAAVLQPEGRRQS